MKKLLLLSLVLLTGCQEYDAGYTREEIAYAKFEQDYNNNFSSSYGEITPDHNWGFDTKSTSTISAQYRIVRPVESIEKIEPIKNGSKFDDNCYYAYNNCPNAISNEEKEYVFKYLQEHPNEGTTTCELNNYFLQNLGQVYHQYTANDGRTIDNRHMDNLHFDNIHFESYNAGVGYDYYVTNTAIINPNYYDSYGSEYIYNHYRFYYIPGYGCYLGFDYVTNSQNGSFSGDGIYDDWVIKVYPGENHLFRVFCEDLGSTFDLDFNDIVFDYCEYGNLIEISVKALIGTLPVYIEDIDLKNGNLYPEDNVNIHFFISKSSIEDVNISVEHNYFGKCFIANKPGRAPYLLCVDPNTQWVPEGIRIETVYPNFYDYVKNPTEKPYWWK